MKMRHLTIALISVGLMAGNAVAEDRKARKKEAQRAKDAVEWRHRSERERDRKSDYLGNWPRETRGHVPHDNNGNGVVERNEWPGDEEAFRRLDKNGDGVLSDADRKLETGKPVHRE